MKAILCLSAILAVAVLCQPAGACSSSWVPMVEIPADVHAFGGTVQRVVEVDSSDTAGLDVLVTSPLLGVREGASVRVAVFGTGIGCERFSIEPRELAKRFRAGSKVEVIGTPLEPGRRRKGVVIDSWELAGGYLAPAAEEDEYQGVGPVPVPCREELISTDAISQYRYLRLLTALSRSRHESEAGQLLRRMIPMLLAGSARAEVFQGLVARYASSAGQRSELKRDFERAYRQYHKLDEPRRTGPAGLEVELSADRLRLNGRQVDLPLRLASLEDILGPPSRRVPARGDQDSNEVIEWEHLGLYAYSRPGSGEAHALALTLAPDLNSRRWGSAFAGSLLVEGVEIGRFTSAEVLAKAGFKRTGYADREVRSSSLYLLLSFYPDPEQWTDVEIGVPTR